MHTPPRTLVIAGNYEQACAAAHNVIYAEAASSAAMSQSEYEALIRSTEFCAARTLVRKLQGANFDRVVIAGNYLRWELDEIGDFVDLWRAIVIATDIRGAKRVWA